MAIRQSTGLRNYLNNYGSYKTAFTGGKLLIYSGSQPATADTAASGTLLVTISLGSGTWTAETPSVATVELTGGGSGTVDTLTANGLEIMGSATTFSADLATTAGLVAAKINAYSRLQYGIKAAVLSGAIISIYAPQGSGTAWNTKDISSGVTTITKTDTDFGSGVAAAYGLTFDVSVAGVIAKSGTWSGTAAADGTAGWFRLCGPIADAQALSTTLIRMDGNISTSGANLNLASTTITTSATITVDTFTITVPAS
jgi:hypothetical protein